MEAKRAEAFIKEYGKFYFDDGIDTNEYTRLGIPRGINSGNHSVEDWIVSNKLDRGEFDKYSLAWKAGKLTWLNGEPDFKADFESTSESAYRNDHNYYIDIDGFNNFCEQLGNLKDSPSDLDVANISSIYNSIWRESTKNIGPVYIIAALFFISKGRLPIYDQFAHKAIRALESDVSPNDIYIGGNPSKDDVKNVMCMYKEYIRLLNKIFPSEIHTEEGQYIKRDLDQALWVYGHINDSSKKFQQ